MSELDSLFYWHGIAPDYINYRGEHVAVPLENRIQLLEAMGVDTSSPEKMAEASYELDVAPWLSWLPPLSIASTSSPLSFAIHLDPQELCNTFHWTLCDQSLDKSKSGEFKPSSLQEVGNYLFEGKRYSRRLVPLPPLEIGYYDIELLSGEKRRQAKLAVVPPKVYEPRWMGENKKLWGILVQLYTLRSARDWGIGDFTDLKILIKNAADSGMDLVGLNPLHALRPDIEHHFSPYCPSDRCFISPLYIDPEIEAEYSAVQLNAEQTGVLSEVRADKLVNYVKVRDLKYSVFTQMFNAFVSRHLDNMSGKGKLFYTYIKTSGQRLVDFACYETVNQRWRNFLDIDKEESGNAASVDKLCVADLLEYSAYKNPYINLVLFHCYLQWLAEMQLQHCQDFAQSAGMAIGLVRDLAVGAEGQGAEVSANLRVFCRRASVGAPPDPLAQTGQNWGLPPMDPAQLRRTGFRHFIELLRANMSRCGALRIDHAMSLMRLWWCPPGKTAAYGSYVYYAFEEMLGLLCLESQRNTCVIIGEDLGVVPPEFRAAIREAKIFSNKVVYFEKDYEQRFKSPRDYEAQALAMVNNHDVPTLVSWWNGSDLEIRNELNLLEEGANYQDLIEQRKYEKEDLVERLKEEELLPQLWMERSVDQQADSSIIEAILIWGSRANSQLFVIQLEDLLLMDDPVNIPGTFHEHANWQRKLSTNLEEIFNNPRIQRLLNAIDKQRKAIGQIIK